MDEFGKNRSECVEAGFNSFKTVSNYLISFIYGKDASHTEWNCFHHGKNVRSGERVFVVRAYGTLFGLATAGCTRIASGPIDGLPPLNVANASSTDEWIRLDTLAFPKTLVCRIRFAPLRLTSGPGSKR